MWYIKNMHICRHCKINEGTIKDCINTYKGKKSYYYACNECNSERARKYRKTPTGKNVYREINRRQYKKYSQKILARTALSYAKRKGMVVMPDVCSNCGIKTRVEGHHPDYSKPLEVIWLCRNCHNLM
jgi:protein-arginine kinase activator protein McsA